MDRAYWVGIVSAAARLAIGLHRPPVVDAYQRRVLDRMARVGALADVSEANPTLLGILCECCRVEVNALRTPRAAVCYACAAAAPFEVLLWADEPRVLETLHACARHTLETQCAWYLLALPRLVYHGMRQRRLSWKHAALTGRDAEMEYLGTCACNALVAAVHLRVAPSTLSAPSVPSVPSATTRPARATRV